MPFFTPLFLTWAAGGSSEPKQEEVKRLPGGKIKKKIQLQTLQCIQTSLTWNESHNIQWTCQVSLVELKIELLSV